MAHYTRRRFLEDAMFAAAAAAAATARPAFARAAASTTRKSPNDTIRVAVVGVNGRGMSHVDGFCGIKGSQVVAICDADTKVFERARKAVEGKSGKSPVFYQDVRKMLEDKSIDVVSIATPNHWHSLGAIWATQAGKDVYVEKPVSHNVHEGRMAVETARKLGRICQCGTQSRSNPGMRELIQYLHSGKLGKITLARGLCYKPRTSIGKVAGGSKPPEGVDYDLWLGPAPFRADVPRQKFHYDWHWQWDYGNGDIGNQGVHEMDKARWGLGKTELPRSVMSFGGRFGYEDDGQTANTQITFFDFGDAQATFEVRGLKTGDYLSAKIGNIWYGSEGYAVSSNYSTGLVFNTKGEQIAKFGGGGEHEHFENFANAVRSRKHTDLNADILDGHLSSAMCHLGNISYRLATPSSFDKKPVFAANKKEAEEAFTRFETHLKDNGVDLGKTQYRLGKELMLDPKTETFRGNKEANALLTREYRKGFEVPRKVS